MATKENIVLIKIPYMKDNAWNNKVFGETGSSVIHSDVMKWLLEIIGPKADNMYDFLKENHNLWYAYSYNDRAVKDPPVWDTECYYFYFKLKADAMLFKLTYW